MLATATVRSADRVPRKRRGAVAPACHSGHWRDGTECSWVLLTFTRVALAARMSSISLRTPLLNWVSITFKPAMSFGSGGIGLSLVSCLWAPRRHPADLSGTTQRPPSGKEGARPGAEKGRWAAAPRTGTVAGPTLRGFAVPETTGPRHACSRACRQTGAMAHGPRACSSLTAIASGTSERLHQSGRLQVWGPEGWRPDSGWWQPCTKFGLTWSAWLAARRRAGWQRMWSFGRTANGTSVFCPSLSSTNDQTLRCRVRMIPHRHCHVRWGPLNSAQTWAPRGMAAGVHRGPSRHCHVRAKTGIRSS